MKSKKSLEENVMKKVNKKFEEKVVEKMEEKTEEVLAEQEEQEEVAHEFSVGVGAMANEELDRPGTLSLATRHLYLRRMEAYIQMTVAKMQVDDLKSKIDYVISELIGTKEFGLLKNQMQRDAYLKKHLADEYNNLAVANRALESRRMDLELARLATSEQRLQIQIWETHMAYDWNLYEGLEEEE